MLSGGLAEDSLLAVDVAGVTAQAPCGTLTMDRLKVSPLGLQWSYHYDENAVQAAAAENGRDAVALVTADSGEVVEFSDIAIPDTELLLVLKDGTQVEVASGFSKGDSGWMEQSGFFARPVDLSQADYLLWGETEIPPPLSLALHHRGGQRPPRIFLTNPERHDMIQLRLSREKETNYGICQKKTRWVS